MQSQDHRRRQAAPQRQGGQRPQGRRAPAQRPRPPAGSRGAQPRRPDNTVPFPGERARPSRHPQAGPAARPDRPGRPQQARPVSRQEARRRRRVTRKMLRRRRLLRRLTAVCLVLCVAAAGIYLTVTMLFKISAIQVQGLDGGAVAEAGPYTSEEILSALGVQLEENIFSFDPEAKAAALERAFPLLEQIEVRRVYPSTVVVQVTPASPAYAMQTASGWLTLSAGLKILTAETAQPALPVLYGGEPRSAVPGEQLAYDPPAAAASASQAETPPDGRLDALQALLAALEQRGLLAGVTRIEYADVEQVAFLYQDRISVLLGTLNELDYKLDYAEYMLLNKEGKGCAETDTGQLDCSHLRTDGTLRAIFAQGEPALPSGYLPPEAEPAPDNAPAAEGEPGAEPPAEDGAPAQGTEQSNQEE